MKPKYIFKDFITGRQRWTNGTFIGWTEPTGLLKSRYAIFQRPNTTLFVPEYLLSKESKQTIILKDREEKTNDNNI